MTGRRLDSRRLGSRALERRSASAEVILCSFIGRHNCFNTKKEDLLNKELESGYDDDDYK